MFLQMADNRYKYYVMAIYDSQTQNNSTRNSRRFRDIDFTRNAVTNDVNVVEDVIAVKRSVRNLIQTNFYERLII